MIKRLPLWRKKFEEAIDEIKRKPFDWKSQHDCGLGLVCPVVKAITGEDFAAQYIGKYNTELGALKMMRKQGFSNLADLAASHGPEIKPIYASVGDVLAFKTDSKFGYALGICNGERTFVLMPTGVGTKNTLDAERAFKVG